MLVSRAIASFEKPLLNTKPANEVFGFDGWSSSIVNLSVDYCDDVQSQGSTRYNIGASAIVRVTLRSGVYHEDIGYGQMQNSPQKGPAFEKVSIAAYLVYIPSANKFELGQERSSHGRCETCIAPIR